MNKKVAEIRTVINSDDENSLLHYGVKRRSGRYPWGSGDEPGQHGSDDFISRIEKLKSSGMNDKEIMESLGMKSGEYRHEIGKAVNARRLEYIKKAQSISGDLGLNEATGKPKYSAIAAKLGVRESTVRGWLDPTTGKRAEEAQNVADLIEKQIQKKGMIDVGKGVEADLGITETKLTRALSILQDKGYPVYSGGIKQPTNANQQTTQKVIGPIGTKHADIFNYGKVHSLSEYTSHDNGETFDKFVYPKSMSSKRIHIRYADEKGADGVTGIEKDGIVELRRGVQDLSLGTSRYSQVRVLVDGKHYVKGMAVYADDLPPGVDMVFNTNKAKGTPIGKVLKDIKNDPDNPFGSTIAPTGQSYYIDKNGKRQLSLINKRADQGNWGDWSNALPAQFLSKQSVPLAKQQLQLAKNNKQDELDTILNLTNPTIKKHLLYKFADGCDAAAVDLKAAALPGQKYHVIIPINTLKDTEVYAPQYEDGTKLALVRFPHGGPFEIPILTVNNKNTLGKKVIGAESSDAIGITKKVADQLSGADFDGDAAMAIPTHDPHGRVKITATKELEGLKGFDAKEEYGTHLDKDENVISNKYNHKITPMKNEKTGTDSTQREMGMISNLITDMSLAGADSKELAAAVRHSMVVIDAAKHKLDYKQSEADNNIKSLRRKYQPKYNDDGSLKAKGGSASTLISRSSSEMQVTKRQGNPKINVKGADWYDPTRPEGSLIYQDSAKATYTTTKINKRTGEEITKVNTRTQASTKMGETDDAYTLLSTARHPMEIVYADYANYMKDLARKARLEYLDVKKIAYSKEAASQYSKEVASLKAKVTDSALNKPKEREVLRRANVEINAKKDAYKSTHDSRDMTKDDAKKLAQQAVARYRSEIGSISRRDRNIPITNKEWEAIQKGAISESKLTQILDNTDIDVLRQLAMPRETKAVSSTEITRIKELSKRGYSIAEIAKKLGKPTSTVAEYTLTK